MCSMTVHGSPCACIRCDVCSQTGIDTANGRHGPVNEIRAKYEIVKATMYDVA
jgi:hypothetical protein